MLLARLSSRSVRSAQPVESRNPRHEYVPLKNHLTPIAVVVAVLLLCGYVGSYYAMVRIAANPSGNPFVYVAEYRLGGNEVAALYYPIHWLDRKLRPGVWEDNLFE